MNREVNAESIGEQLGVESVSNVVSKVEAYCAYEEQRIELTNQPRILALRQEGSLLLEEERKLSERLRHAPPAGDFRSRRQRTAYYWGVTIILTLAAFVFAMLSFEPFRVGWKGYLYCLGIAVATPFLLEQLLEKWNAEHLFKGLAAVACAAALMSLVLLAVIRGDLFAEQMKNTQPVIILDDVPSEPQPHNDFYAETVSLLRLVMALLAVTMELGAGLSLHEAWRSGSGSSEDREWLGKRLGEVNQRMIAITYEINALQNEGPIFAARFWRNFYRSMLTQSIRSAVTRLLGVALAIVLLVSGHAVAQTRELVIAVDLTQSVALTGPDQRTEFQKNIDAVSKLLAQVRADSRVTVIGITDRSFAQPDILLSATVPADAGYFGERLHSAQLQLVRAWKTRSAQLTPGFPHTDILEALMLASEIFNHHPTAEEKILVIFSDMRQHTRELDLESPSLVPRLNKIESSGARIEIANLGGVHLLALGVDGAGKSLPYWQSLREFWTEYFRTSGARLENYTVLRVMEK
jgi:hypothetical protein